MQLRRLGRDTLLYGLSTLLVRGIQIVLIPVYSRVLGSGEYGVVETVTIAGALINLTVSLEISQGMARYIADAPDEAARRGYASTALGFGMLAYGLFLLVVAVMSVPLSQWLLDGHASPGTLLVAAAALAVNGVFVILQDLLRWQLRPLAYLVAGLAYSLGSAGVGIWLVAGQDFGVAGVFWGQLAGAVLGALVAASGTAGLLGLQFDGARLRQMLRYSLPLVLSGVAVFGNLFVDRIVVREVLGLEALGIYGVAARFASVVSILAVGLQAALSPLVFRSWRDPSTGLLLARVCRYYCVFMVPIVGGVALFASEILLIATGPTFHAARDVLPILALAAMFSTLYVFAPGLFLGGRTGRVAALNMGGAFMNLCFSLFLTSAFGMIGAAIAAIISAATVFVGYILAGRAHFPVPYQGARVMMSMAACTALVLLAQVWNAAPPEWSHAQVALKFAVLLATTFTAAAVGLDKMDRVQLIGKLRSLILKRA